MTMTALHTTAAENPANQAALQDDRYARGWQKLKEVDDIAGERVVESLADISPDRGRYIVEFGFGDIYNRPGLTLREREIATIAALTALGNATPQLKVHIHAGLHVGLTRQEITETILQMAVYAGFPAALNGMFAAKEVFAAQDAAAGDSARRETSN
jgi:4-carboxymuconolactone decarboxylase